MLYDFLLNFLRGARTFVHQSNCIDILAFFIGAVFTDKNGAYFNHELIFQLIPTIRSTYSKSNLAVESPVTLFLLILSV